MQLSAPIHVHWELTNVCNLECKHCYQRRDNRRGQLRSQELVAIAKKLTDARVFLVTLTGGEPFSVDCLPDLVKHLTSRGTIVYITSNGTYVNNETAKWMNSCGVRVQISLDSHVPETHDRIRNFAGAFEIAVSAMGILVGNGVKTSLAFCANRLNFSDLGGVVSLAVDLGIRKVVVGEVVPLFDRDPTSIDLGFVDGQYAEFLSNASSIKERYASLLYVQLNTEWGFIYRDMEHSPCTALDRDMAILFTGDASPCPFIRNGYYNLGSLVENNVSSIWNSKRAKRFRQEKHLGCSRSCNFYAVCKSGCKAILANSGKPINRRDPTCPLH